MVLLTDGLINDLPATKDVIVKLSFLPCSLIIVGIGNNIDWGKMDQFNKASGKMKDSNGRECMRDILEFVPFTRLKGNFSEEVLKKVPMEFMSYMQKTGFVP